MKKYLDVFVFAKLFTFIIVFVITANSYPQDKIPNLTQNNFLNINFGHFMLSKNSQWWKDQSNRTNIDIHNYNNYIYKFNIGRRIESEKVNQYLICGIEYYKDTQKGNFNRDFLNSLEIPDSLSVDIKYQIKLVNFSLSYAIDIYQLKKINFRLGIGAELSYWRLFTIEDVYNHDLKFFERTFMPNSNVNIGTMISLETILFEGIIITARYNYLKVYDPYSTKELDLSGIAIFWGLGTYF